jgi:hypothetical protein
MNCNIICFYSSFIFLSNVIISYWYSYYTYSLLFVLLTITSLIFHSNNNIYTNLIDKVSIISIVLYGSYLFFTEKIWYNHKTIYKILIFTTFFTTIYLFYYGYVTNQYCYHNDKYISNIYHSIMHVIASFGHNLIVIL